MRKYWINVPGTYNLIMISIECKVCAGRPVTYQKWTINGQVHYFYINH